MLNNHPITTRFLIFVFSPALLLSLYLFFYLKSSVAPKSGVFEIAGLDHPVQITHDLYGAPRVTAKNDHDAYFSIGFKHAADRLWQLEIQRRLSQGRLSEILGKDFLSQDTWIRTLGLHEAAKKSIPSLNSETIDALTAYSNGVNAWIAQAPRLPMEFQIFDISPEPWGVSDSLSWQKVLSLFLNGNMHDEITRSLLQYNFTPEQIKYFYPYDSLDVLAKKNNSKVNYLISQRDTLEPFGIGHKYAGSNAWVVSGKNTQSGHPMLANDPHLGLQLPALWYAAALKGDRLDVSGMTFVGLPMIISGQNSDIAWGITNLMSDQQDLFVETISPNNPNKYLDDGAWVDFELSTESINVSSSFPALLNESLKPIEITVRKTVRGPVISDARYIDDHVISLRWAALDSEDHTIDSFIQLQYASNWKEFRQALTQLKSPGLNFLYADRVGNIGYQAAGMMPRRGKGDGTLPILASTENADWLDYYNFDLLPFIFNPSNGIIVSANQQINHTSDIVISHDWAPTARHERITHLLNQFINTGKLMTLDDMRGIQGDKTDLSALVLLPIFRNFTAEADQAKDAITVLNKWNGEFKSDSTGATIFSVWSYYLRDEIFNKVLEGSWQRPQRNMLLKSSKAQIGWSKLAEILTTNDHGWCKFNQAMTCFFELQNSLTKTLKAIEKISGTRTVSKWYWADLARADFSHQPFSQSHELKGLFSRTTHAVASPNSVNASDHKFDPFEGFTQTFGAGFRQVFDLDEKSSHWYMLSTGQSGNVMSRHYDDMIIPFTKNQLTYFSDSDQSDKQITLVPKSESE